ncbi:M61 family metallopeptidase [Fontibacter flavus]|uniref:M61 family metallopeptidase n=1 Tax=Fontibacter flavus TaxID=654838 RepID=A0ABV6FW38_9BACT
MQYLISRDSICSQFIKVTLILKCENREKVSLQLAAWRPGRYELANYAQKIRGFQVLFQEKPVKWNKTTKDLWYFEAEKPGSYEISYSFYCNQMDAGGCWSDDTQLYLNFSNFIFEILEKKNQEISIQIDLPKDYQIATALPNKGNNHWKAKNYQHLMDSPLLASDQLSKYTYEVNGSDFFLWFNGEIFFDVNRLIQDFKRFTTAQIKAFGDFPSEEYHFIFQLLPYRHYHGVEHAHSTVITFGPASRLLNKPDLDELMGVSSHELYHFWNVCRIRPKALTTYDLSKETYLESGLVLEGVTTYMGDLFLLKSGYFSIEDYLKILEKQIQRELDHFGWQNQSIVESSYDLWLDGYKTGIPDKKVNIYNRGALISLCLDLMLLDEGSSLSIVMKKMWEKFGMTGIGYSLSDFKEIVYQEFKNNSAIDAFFHRIVFGHEDLYPYLKILLNTIGVTIEEKVKEDVLLHDFGIRTHEDGIIQQIHPESKAYYTLMLGDKVLKINGADFDKNKLGSVENAAFFINRFERLIYCNIPPEPGKFYPKFELALEKYNEKTSKWMK